MGSFYFNSEDLRNLLQNAGRIKSDCRCIYCDGTGMENWNENGEDIKPGTSSDSNRANGECEVCQGLGFII